MNLNTIFLSVVTWGGLSLAVQSAGAATVTFDFNGLQAGDDIGEYMETVLDDSLGVSDSDVALSGAAAIDTGLGLGGAFGDGNMFVASDLVTPNDDTITIRFNTVSIRSVSFDWGTTLNPFVAETEHGIFFQHDYAFSESGHFPDSGTFTFAQPAHELIFHNSGLGNVGIDNLVVTAVPVPGGLWLLGSGALGMIGFRRKFFN